MTYCYYYCCAARGNSLRLPYQSEKLGRQISFTEAVDGDVVTTTSTVPNQDNKVRRYWKEYLGVEAGKVVVNPLLYHREEDNDV